MNTEESMDQVFINKVTHLIEVNLGNEQFGASDFLVTLFFITFF